MQEKRNPCGWFPPTCERRALERDASRLCAGRLSKGLLYILWLQIGQKPGAAQVRGVVRSRLEGLVATEIDLGESHAPGVLASVSIAGNRGERVAIGETGRRCFKNTPPHVWRSDCYARILTSL